VTPEDIQAEWIHTLQGLAISAAGDYHKGILSFEEFQDVMARLYLAVEDNIEPTAAQVAEKIAEMDTAAAFISAGQTRRDE
jgi:hypothetical protein